MLTRMREKGRITIPAKIRKSLHLVKDSLLSIAKVGDGILLTPSPSVFESVSTKFSKAAEEKGITLEDILKDLKKIKWKG